MLCIYACRLKHVCYGGWRFVICSFKNHKCLPLTSNQMSAPEAGKIKVLKEHNDQSQGSGVQLVFVTLLTCQYRSYCSYPTLNSSILNEV